MSSRNGHWKGDEVTDKTGGQAEAGAGRATGRGAITGAEGAVGDRSEHRGRPEGAASGHRSGKNVETAEADQIQEEKRQAAVEQHEEDRAAGTGTAPKNI